MDKNGMLYGTTEAGAADIGNVFRLTPPSQPGGSWSETVLWTFTKQNGVFPGGYLPNTPLLMDAQGNLYGTAEDGGLGYGVVYRLVSPKGGATAWTESVLHRFAGGSDGARPMGGLSWGSNGVLYGTTAYAGRGLSPNCGTAFSLTPELGSGAWAYSVIYNFEGPTDGCSPDAKLLVAPNGALFGTTSGSGFGPPVIFELHQ